VRAGFRKLRRPRAGRAVVRAALAGSLRRGRTGALALAAAATFSAASLAGCGGDDRAAAWVTDVVDRGPIVVEVTATGTVNPVATVQVGTYVSGPIRAIHVDYNSPVRKGQPVATIDPRPFQVKVQQAQANVANARARVAKARADLALKASNLRRSRELRAADFLSESQLDVARSDHAQAVAQLALDEASVQQAQASLAEAEIQLGYTEITSPVDGVVVSRNVDVGQTVAASFQTPTLFLIAEDLTQMQVNANVSESDIGGVQEGQAASFSVDAYPGRRFEGRVVQVRSAPITVQNVVTYDVVIGVANGDLALKPGMTATVSITTGRRDDVVRLPLRALRFRPELAGDGAGPGGAGSGPGGAGGAGAAASPGAAEGAGGSAVYRVADAGGLRRIEVSVGLRDDRHVELLGGDVAPGDAVVVAQERPPEERAAPPGSPFLPQRRR